MEVAPEAPSSPSAPLRLLYTEGFEGWDYFWAGILTDYLLVVVCMVMFQVTRSKDKGSASLRNTHLAFLMATAVTYGFGGAAHHVLNIYHSRGGVQGLEWGDENSSWMLPWIGATVASCFAAALLFALTFEVLSLPVWTSIPGFLVAFHIAVYEVYVLFCTENGTVDTSVVAGFFGSFAALACTLAHAVGLCTARSSIALLVGNVFQLLAFGVVMLVTPSSCREVGAAREGCPFPEQFNHNAVFHVLLIIATGIISVGVQQKLEPDYALVPNGQP
eukprot:TRINITY_DN112227_c0_g1_i1.p1 TRINITY_DN112227_c0_g1~~TRINITY_DN112227_c0_g1_i1.p1  ORF type:complete len:275 (-),score=29.14 TRINITY_DN112227_c0_g1_i1:547-1371(-)